MLTTTRFSLKKPQTSDARSALRTAIGDNADLLETALDLVTPTTVTALPTTSLFDGKLVYLQTTNMAAVGVRWLMRYRLASTKWEFVGGAPWSFASITSEVRGPAADTFPLLLNNQPTDRNGQQCVAPAAGIYRARLRINAWRSSGTTDDVAALLTTAAGSGVTALLNGLSSGPLPSTGTSQDGVPIFTEGETIDMAAGTAMKAGFRLYGTVVAQLGVARTEILPVLLHT